jgi:hypothetical protein
VRASNDVANTPLPLFSQVLILKEVKVVCFDTLLQVFILKALAQPGSCGCPTRIVSYARGGYPTPVFCEKSLDLLDSKGVDFFGKDKESAIV